MRGLAAILTAAALFFGAAGESQAGFSPSRPSPACHRIQVVATVSVSRQQMFLEIHENKRTRTALIWKVSTGRPGLDTPMGSFQPTWLDVDHKSDQYEDAPMPFSVFFSGGYAVHGTEFMKASARARRMAASGSRPKTPGPSSIWSRPTAAAIPRSSSPTEAALYGPSVPRPPTLGVERGAAATSQLLLGQLAETRRAPSAASPSATEA